jgi:thiol-disulfide isomerase/thioredoxin
MLRKTVAALSILIATLGGQELRPDGSASGFKLRDLEGKEWIVRPENGAPLVVVFFSIVCPLSHDYTNRFNELYKAHRGDVRFVFVNSNHNEPVQAIAEHVKKAGFLFPVYKDIGNDVADQLGASVTPQAFVIDRAGAIVYRGAIDNSRNPAQATNPALRNAIEALRKGSAVTQPELKAVGCTIKRKRG